MSLRFDSLSLPFLRFSSSTRIGESDGNSTANRPAIAQSFAKRFPRTELRKELRFARDNAAIYDNETYSVNVSRGWGAGGGLVNRAIGIGSDSWHRSVSLSRWERRVNR